MKTTAFPNTAAFHHIGAPFMGVLIIVLALAGGCTSTSTTSLASAKSTPVMTKDPKLQEELRQLDVFFDNNPVIERELRRNIERWNDATFLKTIPEWEKLTIDRPTAPDALKAESRFLLHRALFRMAGNTRLEMRNLQRLDRFLDAHLDILDALEDDPALLLSLDFQVKHPSLAEFLEKHPDLSSAFYQNAEKVVLY